MPRFYCPISLATGDVLDLPAGAARHVQVLRLQPGDGITLFNGGGVQSGQAVQVDQAAQGVHGGQVAQIALAGGEFEATVVRMGRNDVTVKIGTHNPIEREAARAVHLAIGMPANDRMDWLVEKATELGVASIQPLMTERSVLRLNGERAEKKTAHWQSIAVAACEQCGRNRVPTIHGVTGLTQWMKTWVDTLGRVGRINGNVVYVLSLRGDSQPLRGSIALSAASEQQVTLLSGPEGGFSAGEEQAAISAGFNPVSLGNRVLRAETAALAALTLLT